VRRATVETARPDAGIADGVRLEGALHQLGGLAFAVLNADRNRRTQGDGFGSAFGGAKRRGVPTDRWRRSYSSDLLLYTAATSKLVEQEAAQ
jgi:hypothetical protein